MANLFQFADHLSFPEEIGNLLREDPDLSAIRYGKAFPRNKEETPTIRYRLIHRVPGIDQIERRKPRLRREVTDENGRTTQIWSQWMTCVYQWDVCTSSLEEADIILDQFDRFLRASVGPMINMGARDFIFDEQVVDDMLPKTKDVETRSLRWIAYLHQLEARVVDTIDQVRVRVLESRIEDYQAVTRGADGMTPDALNQTHVARILHISDASPSGFARTLGYFENIDFNTIYDPVTNQTWIMWIDAGKKPAPGATYYVRYLYWDNWARLAIPSPF